MQLKKTSIKIRSLINELKTFSNGYFSFNNIDMIYRHSFINFFLSQKDNSITQT